MDAETLTYFLETYLSVDADIHSSVRLFSDENGQEMTALLRNEITHLLSDPPPPAELVHFFKSLSQFVAPPDHIGQRSLLLRIYNAIPSDAEAISVAKAMDVFVSYSMHDQHIARKLCSVLRSQGFRISFDPADVFFGKDFRDAVFEGIQNSSVLVVLVSDNGLKTKELAFILDSAIMSRIEGGGTNIVFVTLDNSQLPTDLSQHYFIHYDGDIQTLARHAANAISQFRYTKTTIPRSRRLEYTEADEFINNFRSATAQEIHTQHGDISMNRREISITLPDQLTLNIPKSSLLPYINNCSVKINGWGGSPFPYGIYPNTNQVRLPGGIRIVDHTTWPFATFSFTSWEFDQRGFLSHICDLREDSSLDINRSPLHSDPYLAVEWSLLDIARPIMFAANLMRIEQSISTVRLRWFWTGLNGRTLLMLNRRRMGFYEKLTASVDAWEHETSISRGDDLLANSASALEELFWLFGRESDGESPFARDLATLLGGEIPR